MIPQRFSLKLVTPTLQWPLRDGDQIEITHDHQVIGSVDVALVKAFLIVEIQRMQLAGQFDMAMQTSASAIEAARAIEPPPPPRKHLPPPEVLRAKRRSRKRSGDRVPSI